MSPKSRMPAVDRVIDILESSLPFFAKFGYDGTKTKDVAHAAGVSEALIFRHFPNKAALYDALAEFCTSRGERIGGELITSLDESPQSFIKAIYFFMYMIFIGEPGVKRFKQNLDRLLIQSLLGNGVLARQFYKLKVTAWAKEIQKRYEVLVESGLLPLQRSHSGDAVWFAHHLAISSALFKMPKTKPFEYEEPKTLFDQSVLFALRGMGFSEELLREHFNPSKLNLFVENLFKTK